MQQNVDRAAAVRERRTANGEGRGNAAVTQAAPPCADAPLSCAAVDLLAARFRVLAEPMRLRLVGELRDGERCVSDLAASLETAQPNVSRHLKMLEETGIIAHRRSGNLVYYFVIDDRIFRLFGTR